MKNVLNLRSSILLTHRLSATAKKLMIKKPVVAASVTLVVLLGSSATVLGMSGTLRTEVFRRLANTQPATEVHHQTITKPTNKAPVAVVNPTPVPTTPVPQAALQGTSPAPTKYATSPDPRSTTYTTTPPQPSPAAVNIQITHAGQVAPGTLITYNPTKDYKRYYGGDLTLSTSSFAFTKSMGFTNGTFTASIPDGAICMVPSMPWNDVSSAAYVDSTDGSQGTRWTMGVHLLNNPAASLTPYVVHIQTIRVGGSSVVWEYDGFLSVYVDN
jgi:hypothetical protein